MADDDRAAPEDFVPGPLSADSLNQLPRGWLFCKTRESNESDIDGIDVVIAKTYTIPEDGRRYRLTGKVMMRSATAGGVSMRLHVNGVQYDRSNDATLGAGKDVTFAFSVDIEPGAGTHTFDLVVARSGVGANLITALADGPDGSFGIMQLKLDDIGPGASGS